MNRRIRPHALALFVLLLVPMLLAPVANGRSAEFQPPSINDWQIGNIVYLTRGTQIWVAPRFDSCYHTIVPVDDWAVRVIDGPQSVENRTWYDTSRREAGDASGGTGWVNVEQVDQHLGIQDPGRYCPPGSADSSFSSTPTTQDQRIQLPKQMDDLLRFWRDAPLPLKIAIVVIALILLPATVRLRSLGSLALVNFLRAILWGAVLGGVTDLLRPVWEAAWLGLPAGFQVFDPALVLLFLPLIGWGFGYLLAAAGIGFALAALAALALIIIIYLVYALALLGSL